MQIDFYAAVWYNDRKSESYMLFAHLSKAEFTGVHDNKPTLQTGAAIVLLNVSNLITTNTDIPYLAGDFKGTYSECENYRKKNENEKKYFICSNAFYGNLSSLRMQ